MIERLMKLLKLAEEANIIYSFYFEKFENELEFSISKHENDEDTIKNIAECIISVVKGYEQYGIKIKEISQEQGWIDCEDEEFAEADYEKFTLKLEINEEEKCML